jgi:MFS transporter, FSR family, fosmidomycin resistance protein
MDFNQFPKSRTFITRLKQSRLFQPIPRAGGVSDRLVGVSLAARFTDELLSGLPSVLMPTLRAKFGLSYTQVSLLGLTLDYVAAVIEPINGLLIDVWRRPWLMAWGAAGIGLATAVMGLAPTFLILLAGFFIYGMASGPLAHTADVVLVEAYPEAPDRIYARATVIDTMGALLSPLLVSLVFWLGMEWRWLLVGLGLSGLIYALIILRTRFPRPANGHYQSGQSTRQALRQNIRAVLASRAALSWLLFLFVHAVSEAPLQFTTIWLREAVGMSQALIGLYEALAMAVSMVSLLFLDRWLAGRGHRRVLLTAGLALLLLFPAWLWLPGIWPRFVLAVPLNFLLAVFWPIGKAQSLASVPGRGGTITAVQSLTGFVPIPLLFGLLAEWITLTWAMYWVFTAAIAVLLLLAWRMPPAGRSEGEMDG